MVNNLCVLILTVWTSSTKDEQDSAVLFFLEILNFI